MTRKSTLLVLLLTLPGWVVGQALADSPQFSADDLEFFEKQVRPILVSRCFQCHSDTAKKLQANFRIDSREQVLSGGDSGPAAVPGNPEQSLLVEAITYDGIYKMPPDSKLPEHEIATLKAWVARNLPWPGEGKSSSSGTPSSTFDLAQRKNSHWVWQGIRPHPIPEVHDAAWPATDVDRFLLAAMESKGLHPAADADRRVLIRRAAFDLIGLPPTIEEVEAFVNDQSPDAWERLINRLLASPHFGERWARHWLDLVRYAETRGHEFEPIIPNAWQYRDYVIRALQEDIPYDLFLKEHIAGDLLEPPRLNKASGVNESILGTGFWFLGEEVHSPVDIRQDELDRMDNRLDVMTKTFLGMTVACARCHDHKFDAISQRDYYGLVGILESCGYRQVAFESLEHNRQVARRLEDFRRAQESRLLRVLAQELKPGVGHSARYLAAAANFVQQAHAAGTTGTPIDPSSAEGERLRALATQSNLQESVLKSWVLEILTAREAPQHPLHGFALLAAAPDEAKRAEQQKLLTDSAASAIAEESLARGTQAPWMDEKCIADYSQPGKSSFFADGFAFGQQVFPAGGMLFDSLSTGKLPQFAEETSARRDLTWIGLDNSDGNERDHGRLGEWNRSGQILRSPEFSLKGDAVWILARGAGRSYAAMNSHLVIVGPLHGELLMEWGGEPGKWQWIRHDLTRYPGHRLHLEISPVGDGSLEIAAIVQGPQPNGFPHALSNRFVAELYRDPAASWDSLADRFQAAFFGVVTQLDSGSLANNPDAHNVARFANWMLSRPEIWNLAAGESRARVDQVLQEISAEQAKLAAEIQRRSHTAPTMFDGNGIEESVLVRGNHRVPSKPVSRHLLEAIHGDTELGNHTTSGRLQLAEQMVDPEDPLVSRVYVNRVWHHLFGRGIVPSVDNFGVLGEPPSHPELLDVLAREFSRDGWSTKRLIKRLMLSRAYRMQSRGDAQGESIDPANTWWHRMPIRRLEGEVIRDSLLAVSGRLDRTMYGPSVPIHVTEYMNGRGKPEKSGPLDGGGRRTVYIAVRRNFLSPMMLTFDTPVPFSTVGRRTVSNVPAQALILMNDPLVQELSRTWAKRLLGDPPSSTEERIRKMFLEALARQPSEAELKSTLAFLQEQMTRHADAGVMAEENAWADLCHVIFNMKEFVFLR